MTRKLITALLLSGSMLVVACNTVNGVGRDMNSAGRAVSGAAEDAK